MSASSAPDRIRETNIDIDLMSKVPSGLAPGTDSRIRTTIELLNCAPFQSSDVVLDIGIGSGEITASIAKRTHRVVGTGLEIQSYPLDLPALGVTNVEVVEAAVEKLPFPDASFDGVVMSHILEHCLNVGLALHEVRRVLKPGGLLCVLVPPSEPTVCGGHVSVGWNIGQLIYVLTLADYDAAHGHFIKKGYNVCGFVRKSDQPLPKLRHDYGDLRTLADSGRFPLPIINDDPRTEAFNGDLEAVNWPWADLLAPTPAPYFGWKGQWVRRLVPRFLHARLASLGYQLAGLLATRSSGPRPGVNPDALSFTARPGES